MAQMWISRLTVKADCIAVLTNCVVDCPRERFFQLTCTTASTAVMIVAALHSGTSCPCITQASLNIPQIALSHQNMTGISLSTNFIFKCKFLIRMAGFLDDMSHSFGDLSYQDAFVVRLHLGDQLAENVNSDQKTCEDELSCNAPSFLSTIVQPCKNEMQPLLRIGCIHCHWCFNQDTLSKCQPPKTQENIWRAAASSTQFSSCSDI